MQIVHALRRIIGGIGAIMCIVSLMLFFADISHVITYEWFYKAIPMFNPLDSLKSAGIGFLIYLVFSLIPGVLFILFGSWD